MFGTRLVMLAIIACAQTLPISPKYEEPLVAIPDASPVIVLPDTSSAQGTADSKIIQSETTIPHGGTENVVQQQSTAGGDASGGSFNVGKSSSNTQSLSTQEGTSSSSDTDASSVQGSLPGFQGLSAGLSLPPSQVLPAVGAGSAQGTAGSNVVKSETATPQGGSANVLQQQSTAGGEASGGSFNVGKSSSNTQSLATQQGTSSSSDTDASSIQGSLSGSEGFSAGLALPSLQTFPAVGSGSASGTAGSNVITSETAVPHGGIANVVQQQSTAGGEASGGGFNIGRSSSDSQSLTTQHGTSRSSDTDASSIQGSLPGFQGFNAGLAFPSLQTFPGIGSGRALGDARSNIISSETLNPFGGKTAGTQQQSGAGGQASGGSFNVGRSSSDIQGLATQHGISRSSDTDASSIQGSLPGFQGLNAGLAFPSLQTFPAIGSGSASGTAGSNVVTSETAVPNGGTANVVQHQSTAGGEASGGGFNIGRSSSGSQSLATQHGINRSSDTDASSIQGSLPGFQGFNAGLAFPSFQAFPAIGTGRAQGTAGSNVVKSETVTPQGGSANVVQQQSTAGGEASGGSFNVGKSSSNTQSLATQQGTSSSSDTDASSVQGSLPGFQGFNAGLSLPSLQVFPGIGSGTASGTAGSNVVTSETILPHGGTANVIQQQSGSGGEASGGSFNVGRSSSDTQSLATQHGISRSSDTDASSIQGSLPGFQGFNAGLAFPSFQALPAIGSGSATGKADSTLKLGESVGPDGSKSKVTVLGSSAGGSAQDGGISVNKASGSTSSIDGIAGSQRQSHTDSESIQIGG